MQDNFKAISLNLKLAPLKIRELVALNEGDTYRLLQKIAETTNANDVLVLSTCNRTEVYYAAEEDYGAHIIKLIGVEKCISDFKMYHGYFEEMKGKDAVRHLFRVSAGLEAQVVGDMQITNQVKRAYQATVDEDMAGPFLHRLMHTIFYTNKRIVQETPFRDGAASVSYATTELVQDLVERIIDPKILVLGVGEIGADLVRNLHGYGEDKNFSSENIKITNRTFDKAKALADECGFEAIPFEKACEAVKEADLVVSSVGGEKPFIDSDLLSGIEGNYHKYLIDLAVPRSIEPEVEQLGGILLYNIDDIENKATKALEQRIASIPQVETIIENSMNDLGEWAKEMEVSPTINKLKNALEEIRQEELARHLKGLSPDESQRVEKLTKSMMQKIIKLPVLQLKAACKRGEAETLIGVLNDLFNLEDQPEKQKDQ